MRDFRMSKGSVFRFLMLAILLGAVYGCASPASQAVKRGDELYIAQ